MAFSFWAKADTNKFLAIDLGQYFGSGGSTAIQGIGATKVCLTTSWSKYVLVVDLPSIEDKIIGTDNYLQARFWYDAGGNYDDRTASLGNQSGTFDIAQVKLEKGSVATPFVPKTFAEELRDCQRYYCKSYDLDVVPGTVSSNGSIIEDTTRNNKNTPGVRFPSTMRAVPTVTIYNPSSSTPSAVENSGDKTATPSGVGEVGIRNLAIPTGVTTSAAIWHYVADAEI